MIFQNWKIIVKWHGSESSIRSLPGGGPAASTFGLLEYLGQSNNNADWVSPEDRFKFVDDLTCLEIINLLSIGLASHNPRLQVASDLPVHGQIIENTHLQSQKYLDEINRCTSNQKMLLNESKTKAMVVNFTKKYEYSFIIKFAKMVIKCGGLKRKVLHVKR